MRVIWYEAPDNLDDNEKDSTALFTRLNMGRIPLTDAELVKALLLAGVRTNNCDRAQELAAQWDGIERDLHTQDIWAFVVGANAGDENEKYPTRISLLLDTLAPFPSDRKRPRYHTFETLRDQITGDPLKFWQKVLGLHALILGWFGNTRLYNKIGFLVATGTSFGKLVLLAKEQGKKSEFEVALNELIRKRIDICESGLLSLSYNNKHEQRKLLNLLLLMNVETVSRTDQRFPFRRHVGKI